MLEYFYFIFIQKLTQIVNCYRFHFWVINLIDVEIISQDFQIKNNNQN